MINNKLLANEWTNKRLSLWLRFKSLSSVSSVMPMMPFIGVRISWDIFARNSDFERFASSAASRAAVFFWIDSRRLYTIWLICVFNESISPLASTVMNRLKSPSMAAAEIWAKPRTCVVKLLAIVFTDILRSTSISMRSYAYAYNESQGRRT